MGARPVGRILKFGIDELEGLAADIGAALDRLEARHDRRVVIAALQLAAFRRIAQEPFEPAELDALIDVARLAFERCGGAVKGRA